VINVGKKRISDYSISSIGSHTIGQQKEWLLKQLQLEEKLENERIEGVKEAVRTLNLQMRRTGIAGEVRKERIEEVRGIVGTERAETMQLKKSIMKETIVALQYAKTPFNERPQKLAEVMGPIIETVQDSAGGLETLHDVIKSYNEKAMSGKVTGRREFIQSVLKNRRLEQVTGADPETKEKWSLLTEKYRQAEKLRSGQKRRFVERIGQWTGNMIRILAEIFAGERLPWTTEEHLSISQLDQTKNSIRTYTRDINLNVLVFLGLFIALVAVLLLRYI
jgi:hypothetical protein